MSFISLTYLLFLTLVFVAYWQLGKDWRAQNVLILVASYMFYGCWSVECLGLIFVTTLCSYLCALTPRRWANVANIVVNLGILGIFKYFGFFATSLCDAAAAIGITLSRPTVELLLPVGISFYTFQALSYTIDVHRGRMAPCRDFVAYAAYISFFPQLVAGPIERAERLLPTFRSERHFGYDDGAEGMRLILLGVFKKMMIADNCAAPVDAIFGHWQTQSSGVLMIGAVLFACQIYGDFSGYSDIARGSARLLGFDLTKNFLQPYFSRSMRDFWQRWHVSLQSWFRDYVYIPLGGSRCSTSRWALNILAVFGLSGLWHGAAWTFVAWGVYHAVLYVISARTKMPWGSVMGTLTTFAGVVVGWIIFRSATLADAWGYVMRMVSLEGIGTLPIPPSATLAATALASMALLMVCEYVARREDYTTAVFTMLPRSVRPIVYIVLALVIFTLGADSTAFIYFQF